MGRRIKKVDSVASETTLYYHNNNWQVLAEYDVSGNYQKMNVFGNYIDELLYRRGSADTSARFYAHDHLFSPVASIANGGSIYERYEYDAYGNCQVMNASYFSRSTPQDHTPYPNPYLFTGRRIDILDGENLKIMYYRNRYYDPINGRFLSQDPLGINPADGKKNPFAPKNQYKNGVNIYQYVANNPITNLDPKGLDSPGCDGIPGKQSPCQLECCALHDWCYDVFDCDAGSWGLGCGPHHEDCADCNKAVFNCFVRCIGDDDDDEDRYNYYCGSCGVWFDDPQSPHMNHSTN